MYEESREIWKNWRKAQPKDPIVGYCNWEVKHDNFKLECWNTEINDKIEPVIYQFWKDGNGFQEYTMPNTNKLERKIKLLEEDIVWIREKEVAPAQKKSRTAQLALKKREKNSIVIPDIRNNLSPTTTLISMLEIEEVKFDNPNLQEIYTGLIKEIKKSTNYLSQSKIYDI